MIKLHSNGIAPDYTEHGSVTTDCITVGEFITQAASIFKGDLTIQVNGRRYEFSGNPKMRVADYTTIDEVTYTSVPGITAFYIRTKPKTVLKSGWVNIYADGDNRFSGRFIYESEFAAANIEKSEDGFSKKATVRIEWEEVVNE